MIPFTHPEDKSWDSKTFCVDAMQQNTFITRPDIHWRWNHRGYKHGRFGSSVGPADSFFDSGLHELAHCIDFMLLGRPGRIHFDGLEFKRPYSKQIYMMGQIFEDGYPSTARASWCEIRAFAIQTFLMKRCFGTYYGYTRAPYGEPDRVREYSFDEILVEHTNELDFAMNDSYIFNRKIKQDRSLTHGQMRMAAQDAYIEAIKKMFRMYDTPFGERRIKFALDRISNRIGELINQNRDVFDEADRFSGPRRVKGVY